MSAIRPCGLAEKPTMNTLSQHQFLSYAETGIWVASRHAWLEYARCGGIKRGQCTFDMDYRSFDEIGKHLTVTRKPILSSV